MARLGDKHGAVVAAMDFIERGEPGSESWKTDQLAILEEAKKPKAQMLVMIAPSIQKLIDAARPSSPSQ